MAKRKPSENTGETAASFEESLVELQTIVADLEDGSLGLETSLARFEKGIGLLRTCYSILEAAEAKVEILTQFSTEEPPGTAPFDTSATLEQGRQRSVPAKANGLEQQDVDSSAAAQEESARSLLF